ncbi:MAG: hypothetical protein JXB49_33880 [Bacteroidales bacterium]|nr:hypothetical protein [Bacteroidales bacterium]
MTKETVNISIFIKVGNVAMETKKMVAVTDIEEIVHSLSLSIGQQILHTAIGLFDTRIA